MQSFKVVIGASGINAFFTFLHFYGPNDQFCVNFVPFLEVQPNRTFAENRLVCVL